MVCGIYTHLNLSKHLPALKFVKIHLLRYLNTGNIVDMKTRSVAFILHVNRAVISTGTLFRNLALNEQIPE